MWLFRGSLRFPQDFILLPCGILVIWLAGTVAGLFYAWAMYRRGRVEDAIMTHATTNALIAAEVLIFGTCGSD